MNFLRSETAASEAIGHAILLGITVTGVSMILLYGVPAILSLEDMANIKNAEQTFTLLDSRASIAALGDSPLQITNINLGGGALAVKPNSGASNSYIWINSSSFNFMIPMGKIEYQFDDRIIAYEGGGVWSKYPSGSVMLSPPAFHYNGVTLTLPVTNISGNASVGGKGTASVSFKKTATIVQYPNTSFVNRTNPINYNIAGKVYVNITSDFYDAWYYYARTLPYTKVSKNSTTKTTSVEFAVIPVNLEKNSSIPDNIVFRGLGVNPNPLRNFSFRINSISNMNDFDWQMSTKSGSKTLVIQLKERNNNEIKIRVGYKDTSVAGQNAETWRTDDGDGFLIISGNYADIDMLNKTINIEYNSEDVPSGTACGLSIDHTYFNDTSAFSWLPEKKINLTTNTTQSLYNVTQHYFQLMMQDVPLNNCLEDGNINYATSSMLINYTGNLSYLHITENRADAEIS
ncbi:MAG: hypothetical protein PHU34_06115 [Candidatus Methanoperedens sp.]|nr:hypothetical protein [Candidatus Methanoperedens sp.]